MPCPLVYKHNPFILEHVVSYMADTPLNYQVAFYHEQAHFPLPSDTFYTTLFLQQPTLDTLKEKSFLSEVFKACPPSFRLPASFLNEWHMIYQPQLEALLRQSYLSKTQKRL